MMLQTTKNETDSASVLKLVQFVYVSVTGEKVRRGLARGSKLRWAQMEAMENSTFI